MVDSIYKVDCKNYDKCYIGETCRPLYKRQSEHLKETEKATATRTFTRQEKRKAEKSDAKSALAEHAIKLNHVIDWEGVQTIERESNYRMRGIKEAIHIRKNPLNMNRPHGDRYLLPRVWNSLLREDSKPAGPSHNLGRGTRARKPGATSSSSTRRSRRGRGGRGASENTLDTSAAVPSVAAILMKTSDSGRNVK